VADDLDPAPLQIGQRLLELGVVEIATRARPKPSSATSVAVTLTEMPIRMPSLPRLPPRAASAAGLAPIRGAGSIGSFLNADELTLPLCSGA
jgi:hypothetical protein